jgi:hypothetical protein
VAKKMIKVNKASSEKKQSEMSEECKVSEEGDEFNNSDE